MELFNEITYLPFMLRRNKTKVHYTITDIYKKKV